MNLQIAIIGNHGTLVKALVETLNDYQVSTFGRPTYDMKNKVDLEDLSKKLNRFDVIIYCAGVFNTDAWETFTVNTVAPAYLCESLAKENCNAHIILVGSHSGTWTSWPNIEIQRLWYNLSKQSLTAVATGLSHSQQTGMRFTAFNPCKFASSMNNNIESQLGADDIALSIKNIIENPAPPVVYEMDSLNVRQSNST